MGETVNEKDEAFTHWSRLWDIYNNNQLLTTFKELMRRCGLKVWPILIDNHATGLLSALTWHGPGGRGHSCMGPLHQSACRFSWWGGWRPSNRTASWTWCGRCTECGAWS